MIDNSFNIGSDFINIKTTDTVTMNETFSLTTEDGVINLDVKINADFQNIPKKYHEVFLNILTSKYLNKVSFSDNPFSECKKNENKKWWGFWKTKK
jgi:hypothetical protein